jgi:hypothetical protein
MKEYRVVDELQQNSRLLEDLINETAHDGFRPIFMTASADGLVTIF